MLMQVLDVDYKLLNNRPIVRIFGRSKDGKSYCVFVKGHLPYFFVLSGGQNDWKEAVKQRLRGMPELLQVTEESRFIPTGFSETPLEALRVVLSNPAKVPEARDALSDFQVFEADILFKNRFLVDKGMMGMGWVEVSGRPEITKVVSCSAIEAETIEPKESDELAELKTLSLDIEISGPNDRKPSAESDPIIMVALAFSRPFKGKETVVLCSRQTNDAQGYDDEKKMLEALKETIIDYDPDIITGYNINGFDLPFIIDRMKKLSVAPLFGRAITTDKGVYYKNMGNFTSATEKNTGNIRVTATGRVIADAHQLIKKNFHMKRYTLEAVAKEILGQSKLDVDHKEIRPLWESRKSEDTKKLIEYSRRDAKLALDLLLKTNVLEKYIALAKVSGVLLQDALEGGEATRIEALLLSEFNKRGIILPNRPGHDEVEARKKEKEAKGLKGGHVLTPEAGLHTNGAILVLDFKSLYPSIIRTYNICPTTLLREGKEDGHLAPSGAAFCRAKRKKGVIPHILGELIRQRSEVKKLASMEKSPERRRILDAKQQALKIMANAFYGYLGYERARIYIIDVAGAVTSFGRRMIKATRKHLKKQYGYRVIYGDTDSLMIKTDILDLDEAHRKGKEISENVTLAIPKILKRLEKRHRKKLGYGEKAARVPKGILSLEFEKVYKSMLILTKKRYAGLMVEKTLSGWTEKLDMRGIETVRRDWCELVCETMNVTLEIVLKENDIKKAADAVKERVRELQDGKIPLAKLTVTKGITRNLDSYRGKGPHISLALKLRKRDPTNAPAVGDRLSYVIVRGNTLLSDRAETPEFILEHKLPVDASYYIENQLLPPLERIFFSMGIDKDELLGRGRQHKITDLFRAKGPAEEPIWNFTHFVCGHCNKSYEKPTLKHGPRCECGGELLFSNGFSTGRTAVLA